MKIQKTLPLSLIVALFTALLVTSLVQAATYYSEGSLYHHMGSFTSPGTYSSGGCAGGSCRYLTQDVNVGAWHWTESYGVYDWYAYCPTIGQAAAKYAVTEETGWDVVMNQGSIYNQGDYVYIGYNDWSHTSSLYTSNACVSGWGCYGLPVYWDDIANISR